MRSHIVEIEEQHLHLHPLKSMYWAEEKLLVISDPHFSKSAHFRKNGIAVPGTVDQSNYQKLDVLINEFEPEKLLILGDLFHSDYNNEMNDFLKWRRKRPELPIYLTLGNHDFLEPHFYASLELKVNRQFRIGPFCFLHDPNENEVIDPGSYVIHGHIHPSVKIRGKGRQSLYLPCFRFGKQEAVLPCFGSFTGTHQIEVDSGDRIITILEDELFELQNTE